MPRVQGENKDNIYPPSLHPCVQGGDFPHSPGPNPNILVCFLEDRFIYLGATWAILHVRDLFHSPGSNTNIPICFLGDGFIYLAATWVIPILSTSPRFIHVSSSNGCVCTIRALQIWKEYFDCHIDRWVLV